MPEDNVHLVYLASSAVGLELERYDIERLMARNGLMNIGLVYHEQLGAYDWELVRQQISKADAFLLLLGDDYGVMSPTGISYLHREYVHAQTLNKPTYAYIKNTVLGRSASEGQRQLVGFHTIIQQQVAAKTWHLREELMAHLRSTLPSLMSRMGGGWLKQPASIGTPSALVDPVLACEVPDEKQRAILMRQVLPMQVEAKVYEAGNLTREAAILPVKLEQVWHHLSELLAQGVSEDRLRAHLESTITPLIKKQLLARHTKAHAVDDVRVSRSQFLRCLQDWQALGLVVSEGSSARKLWRRVTL